MTTRRRIIGALGCVSLHLMLAVGATQAQSSTPCQAVLDYADNGHQVNYGPGRVRQFASGNVRAHCDGQETFMSADSVAWMQDIGQFEMVGRALFRDTTVTLNADRTVYFLSDERLEAYGNVRLVNVKTGTVLTGPNLTYWRRVPALRDTTKLYATNRPTVEYTPPQDSADAEPYIIIGDEIRLVGEAAAWSGGNVRIDRSDFHSESDSAQLNLASHVGELFGNAAVRGGDGDGGGGGGATGDAADTAGFHLRGHEIAFASVNNELSWVQAQDSAEAVSADFVITADTVELSLRGGRIQGGLAWGDLTRSQVVSATNTITADSIAIDSPDQELQELRGFGSARATSAPDSLDGEVDWIAGDTLVARFEESGLQRRFLERLTAIGNAAAFYRVYRPEGGDVPDINYSRGDHITALFGLGGLLQIDVIGNADGVHLESAGRGRQP